MGRELKTNQQHSQSHHQRSHINWRANLNWFMLCYGMYSAHVKIQSDQPQQQHTKYKQLHSRIPLKPGTMNWRVPHIFTWPDEKESERERYKVLFFFNRFFWSGFLSLFFSFLWFFEPVFFVCYVVNCHRCYFIKCDLCAKGVRKCTDGCTCVCVPIRKESYSF